MVTGQPLPVRSVSPRVRVGLTPLDRVQHDLAQVDTVLAPHPPEHFDYGLRLLINGLRADLTAALRKE